MTDLTTARATDLRAPDPGVPDRDDRDDVLPEAPPPALPVGVALPRLLSLVRLSAPQALELGAGLLAATAGRETPRRARPGDRQHRRAGGPRPRPGRRRQRGAQPALGRCSPTSQRRPAPRPAGGPGGRGVPHRARRGGDGPAGAGCRRRRGGLQEALAGTDRDGVRAELAALVRAVSGRAAPAPGGDRRGPASPVARAAPARPATAKRPRTAWRRIGAWLLSVLVLGAVVVAEVVVLRDDIAADVGLLLDAGRSGGRRSPPRRSRTARRSRHPPLPRPAA